MFDVAELTIAKFHSALSAHETTVEEVVAAYLQRIAGHDGLLRSIIHLNPNALQEAREKDAQGMLPEQKLFGVPVILKDTYLTSDLPTTCGSKSLVGLRSTDGFIVTKLQQAGAIILAKANCHEFSLQGCTFSSLGGQTLNPYDLTRTPGGSSGGTASAIAASFGLVGLGGDTMNSIRSPASACNLVGLRPSMGVVGRSGIFPVAHSQDAVGPICRTLDDLRILFDVIRGPDPDDISTLSAPALPTQPVSSSRKLRIGVLRSYFPSPDEPDAETVLEVIRATLVKLSTIADISEVVEEDVDLFSIERLSQEVDVQAFELRFDINNFLSSKFILDTPHRTLSSIAKGGQYDSRALTSNWHAALLDEYNMDSVEYRRRLAEMSKLKHALSEIFTRDGFDVLLWPHQRRLVMKVGATEQRGRNGLVTSLTGFPSLCVPAGWSASSEEAPLGVPVGMEIVGRLGDDLRLLDVGMRINELLGLRRPPILTTG